MRGGKERERKAGSPDSLQSENPGTRERREQTRGRRGSRAQGRDKRTTESKSTRGGVERGAGSPGTSLARKTRSQRERLRNKGQYRGVRSQCTNVQGAIYSVDDTSL